MGEFDAPSYDGDVETADGMPAGGAGVPGAARGGRRLRDRLAGVQRLDARCAEERGRLGVAGAPQPFNERHGLLLSASPSMVGGNRGLWALRVPLEHLGARIYPDMFSLAQAHKAFDRRRPPRRRTPPGTVRRTQPSPGFMDLVEACHALPVRQASAGSALPRRTSARTSNDERGHCTVERRMTP